MNLNAVDEVNKYLDLKAHEFLEEFGVLERDLRRKQGKTTWRWETETISFITLRRVVKQLAKDNKRSFIVVEPHFRWIRVLPGALSNDRAHLTEYHLRAPRNKKTQALITFLYLQGDQNMHLQERSFSYHFDIGRWELTKQALRTNNEIRQLLGLPRR